MGGTKKTIKISRYGLSGTSKKLGVNLWRCFFTAFEKNSATEQKFFLELEMVNSALSPAEPLLGFKPRVTITEEDLQYNPDVDGSKTDFAMKLVFDNANYNVPKYIENGLIWLNSQKMGR